MAKTQEDQLDRVVNLLQDLFVLHALQAGAGSHAIRQILGVSQERVSKVSNLLKAGKKD